MSKKGRWGYATRSLRSALLMKSIDLLNPFARDYGPPHMRGECVISSLAGIGDLFIHLPLIEGIYAKICERGGKPTVVLRPSHAEVGRRCGWEVREFENPLQDLFGRTINQRLFTSMVRGFREMRNRKPELWLDLTGNAFNALSFRTLGVRNIAARVTRGGKSFVRHRLPNEPFENEYTNRERLANYLGCTLDYSVFRRLCLRDPEGHIVLGISTNCPWRNWPLSRFTELARLFPDRRFVLTGFRREINPGSEADLEKLKERPNVIDCMDRLSLIDLIKSVATAAAVVTNDTGTAHIANAWSVPGAVLFGPGISEQWAAPEKLRCFHDRSCSHYPCVAWRCETPKNWCMKRIATHSVAEHLRAVLAVPSRSGRDSI